jgi:hypothetical protein
MQARPVEAGIPLLSACMRCWVDDLQSRHARSINMHVVAQVAMHRLQAAWANCNAAVCLEVPARSTHMRLVRLFVGLQLQRATCNDGHPKTMQIHTAKGLLGCSLPEQCASRAHSKVLHVPGCLCNP